MLLLSDISNVIIQYGYETGFGGDTTKTITLPQQFTTECTAIAGSSNYVQGNGDKRASWAVEEITATSFKLHSRFEQGSGKTIYWIAVGY